MTVLDLIIIFFAKYVVWMVVATGAVYLFVSARWRDMGLLTLVSLPIAYLLGKVAGMLWYDQRPFAVENFSPLVAHAANNGFPSDHTLFAATVASIVFVYNRALGMALFFLAFLVGVARILAGVHRLVDILTSLAIAAVTVALVHLLSPRIQAFVTYWTGSIIRPDAQPK